MNVTAWTFSSPGIPTRFDVGGTTFLQMFLSLTHFCNYRLSFCLPFVSFPSSCWLRYVAALPKFMTILTDKWREFNSLATMPFFFFFFFWAFKQKPHKRGHASIWSRLDLDRNCDLCQHFYASHILWGVEEDKCDLFEKKKQTGKLSVNADHVLCHHTNKVTMAWEQGLPSSPSAQLK